ncbi:unnamed protein product, partial [Vitis vinifera]|uniref:Uncharacterized protein n=1 Tax=Vitis vinifera TaxID=29760 RepID=D7SNH5_VITVI
MENSLIYFASPHPRTVERPDNNVESNMMEDVDQLCGGEEALKSSPLSLIYFSLVSFLYIN